jgi:hypothetical protein
MTSRAWLIGFLAFATAAGAQPAPTAVSPSAVDRARITASPALSEALASRIVAWTFRNDSEVPVTTIRLKPDGATEFGPSLIEGPVGPGESRRFTRQASLCLHHIDLRFANGGRRRLTQNLCEQPELRMADAPMPATAWMGTGTQTMSRPPATVPPATAEIVRPVPPPPPPPPPPPAAIEPPVSQPPRQTASRPPAASRPTAARPAEAAPTRPDTSAGAEAPPAPAEAAPGLTPGPAPEAGATGPRVYCPLLEEEVPPIVCERATAVDRGVAGVKAKSEMVLNEVQVVRLVVSRTGDTGAVVDELGGPDEVYRQFKLATGRYMEAQLVSDGGLEIKPTGWIRRDLGAGDLEDWEWQVKALAKGRHQVILRTRVMKELEDGSFIPRPGRESEPQYVDVRITGEQNIEEKIGLFTRWTQALAAPAESLTNLLTLLGTLVGAAGALWAALRAFGRKPKDEGGDGS